MAISETKGQGQRAITNPVKEGQQYINLNPGRLFVQQPPKNGKIGWLEFDGIFNTV